MRNLIQVVAVVLFTSFCTAQKFKSGYFIDNFGNKTSVFISSDILSERPKSTIEYRKQEKGSIETIDCAGLSEIVIDDVINYKKFKVKVDDSPKDVESLTAYKTIDLVEKEVFLELLEKGKLNLYSLLHDKNKYSYYYSKEGMEAPELLDYKEYIGGPEGNLILKNEFYKQELIKEMADAKFSNEDFFRLQYREEELVALFKKYNTSFGRSEVVNNSEKKAFRKIKFYFKPRIGASFVSATSQPKRVVNSNSYFGESEFSAKIVPEIGAEIELKVRNSLGLFFVATYHSYKQNGTQTMYNSLSPSYSINTEIKSKSLRLNLGLRKYFQLNSNYDLYAGGYVVFEKSQSGSYSKTMNGLSSLNDELGVGVGIGTRIFKRISVEANYEFNRNLTSDLVSVDTPFSTFSLVFMYSLFK